MLAMVLGGSGSGKSEYAENLAVKLNPGRKLYIATMYPWDEESRQRIERHRSMRAEKNFDTLECFYHLEQGIRTYQKDNGTEKHKTVFLDCMSNLVANEMYCKEGYESLYQAGMAPSMTGHILQGIDALAERYEHVVIVSNDVFTDGVVYDEEMQKYLSNLAAINAAIAERAEIVVESVCGIPVVRKGKKQLEALYESVME